SRQSGHKIPCSHRFKTGTGCHNILSIERADSDHVRAVGQSKPIDAASGFKVEGVYAAAQRAHRHSAPGGNPGDCTAEDIFGSRTRCLGQQISAELPAPDGGIAGAEERSGVIDRSQSDAIYFFRVPHELDPDWSAVVGIPDSDAAVVKA